MTDDVLATVQEIEARCAAATPGPWGEAQLAAGVRHLERNESDWYFEDLPEGYNLPGRQGDGGQRDGAFIAHAREDVPWLCQAVRRLLQENEAVQRDRKSTRLNSSH